MKDLTGERFGRWTVISFDRKVNSVNGANYYWNCKCDCGTERSVSVSSLRGGSSTSCGCLNKEIISRPKKHGMSNCRLYWIWHSMMERCSRKTNSEYKNYGARGISVCEEWKDSSNFIEWALRNGYEDNLTIDRIDTNGNYCPENCRWADWKTQANNTRRNRFVEIDGVSKTVAQWAEIYGISYRHVYRRRSLGWSYEKALTTPIRPIRKKVANE